MIKSIALATVTAAALTAPALTNPAHAAGPADPSYGTAEIAAHGAELANSYEARQAQKLLIGQGYTAVSDMERVANGRWIGTAQKDGKTLIVGVNLPKPVAGATN